MPVDPYSQRRPGSRNGPRGRGGPPAAEAGGAGGARGRAGDGSPEAEAGSAGGAARAAGARGALPLFAAYAALAVALAWTGPRLDALVPATAFYTGLFALLLILVHRHGATLDRGWILLGGAAALRLVFLPALPDLSVDPFRYVWDGWLTVEGLNPYRHTPSDPALVERHGEILFREMNSRDFFSIYPPLSQWLFAPAGAVHAGMGWPASHFALKATVTLAELVGVLLLHRALREEGLAPRWLALYAWNPLVLVTVAGVGHSEGGLVLALGVLALGIARRREAAAWAGLGLAVISKGIPIVVAPLLFRHHRARVGTRGTLAAAGLGLMPAALLSLPFLFPGLAARATASANLYVGLFEFNAGLFAVLRDLVNLVVAADAGAFVGSALRWGFLAAAAWIGIRHRADEPRQVVEGGLLLFGLYLVTATTVHPWYLLWGLPLVAFTTRHRSAWLWAAWAGFLTYFAYVGVPEGAIAAAFWGGVLLLGFREEAPRLRDSLLPWAGRRKARQLAPHLRGGTVLDLGAGEGWVGAHMGAPGRRVFLADIGPSFRAPLRAFVYDGRRLPLRDRAFDTVVLSLVCHHADDPDAVLREALRVGRRVVVTESTYRYGWERRVLDRLDRAVNRGRGEGRMARGHGPLHFDTVEGWLARIAAAGGNVIVSRRLNRLGHRHHLFVAEPRAVGSRRPDTSGAQR